MHTKSAQSVNQKIEVYLKVAFQLYSFQWNILILKNGNTYLQKWGGVQQLFGAHNLVKME
jgi:hypothetical protein